MQLMNGDAGRIVLVMVLEHAFQLVDLLGAELLQERRR